MPTTRNGEGQAIRLFLGAVISIFAAEILVMFFLPYFPPLSPVIEAVVDGFLLSVISLPMFYLFLLRPLLAHVREIQNVDDALRVSHEMLETRVQEQTADLLQANETLQREINEKEQAVHAWEKAEKVRKSAEASIRNSEAKLNAIFNSTLDGILVADTATMKFLTGNRAICEMLGYTLEELGQLHVDDIHPAESLAFVREQFQKQARKEINLAPEIPLRRKDGTVFFSDIVSSPMHIGEQHYLIGVFRDASERREVEARMRQSQKLEAIGTLAGGIAHDFNNILTAILGYSDLALGDTEPGTTIHDDLQQVVKAGKRAKELIKQILTLSRQSTMESSPQRLQVIVKEVVKLLRATIPTTIEIRQEIETNCEPVLADPTQIHQILMNLCTNAFHAMEQTGGVLEIALREIDAVETDEFNTLNLAPGRYVRLDVTDTGCGMEPSILDRIFEPYYTTKPQGKGSGLGLAVVHGIVESHGGRIVCRSEPGKGTTFSVLLPVAEKIAEEAPASQAALPGGSERILYLDDEEALALLGKKILQSLGYTVFTATDSVRVLKKFQDDPGAYDLVITDQTMPGMSGENLAKKILEVRPDIPVILCTGHSTVINEEMANSIGIAAFLMKPIDKRVLAETIRRVLDAEKAEQVFCLEPCRPAVS